METNVEYLKPLFICGRQKSGTTLLQSLLDSHQDLLVFPLETFFFSRALDSAARVDVDELLRWVDLTDAKSDFRDDESYILPATGRLQYRKTLLGELGQAADARQYLLAVFRNWLRYSSVAGSQTLKYWVEKTPKNETHHARILAVFPDARFLHMVRHPLANYHTYCRKYPGLEFESFFTKWRVSTRRALRAEGSDYRIVRYEDIVSNPRQTMDGICDFLSLEFDPVLLQPTKNGLAWPGNSWTGQAAKKVHAKSLDRYKQVFDGEEMVRYRQQLATMEPELLRLGYADCLYE